MKTIFRFQLCCIFLLALILTGCKVKRPNGVISEAKMENLLYDYHIAKAMGESLPYNENYKKALYIEAVFKKHGTTEADFDSSMVWYTRNTEYLSKIYEKVNVRLKAQRDQINHLIALRDKKPHTSTPGDSIDVWAWQRSALLNNIPLNNKFTFVLPSDTNFKKRDILQWEINYHFLNNQVDSTNAAIMAMQIIYENDSIYTSQLKKVTASGIHHIRLQSDTLIIKEIRGFIYYPQNKNMNSVLTNNISLFRYHSNDSIPVMPKDSLQKDSIIQETPDKKIKPDTIKINSAHERSNPKDLNRPSESVKPVRAEQQKAEEHIREEKQELQRQQRRQRRPLRN